MIEPLGYGLSSHPKNADYSFTPRPHGLARTLDSLGVKRALFVAQSSGAAIAFRLAILRPDLVRGSPLDRRRPGGERGHARDEEGVQVGRRSGQARDE